MDLLCESATTFAKLLGKYYVYKLEDGQEIRLYFAPASFHHLMGLQKLKDTPAVKKSSGQYGAAYIFRQIISGNITIEDIKKSRYFDEVEPRLRHFKQINRIVETAETIFEFDPSLIHSDKLRPGCILFKMSNNGMYLNLLIKIDSSKGDFYVPYTFIPRPLDDYTRGQRAITVKSKIILKRDESPDT